MGYTKLKDDKENDKNTSKATHEEPRPQKEGDEVKEDKNTVESIIGAVGGWSETDREPPNTQKEEEIDQKRSNKGKKDFYDLKKKLKTQGEIVIALKKDNEELTGLKEDYEELIGLKEDYEELLNKYMKLKDVKEKEKNTSKATQEEPRPQKEGDEVKEDNITVEPIIEAVGGWSETDREPPNAQKEEEIDQKRSNKGKKDYYDLKKKLKTQGEIVIALKKDNEELIALKEDYEELLNKYMKLKDVKEKEKNTSKATQEKP